MKTGLTVIAHITARKNHEHRVREALLDLVAQTRRETGCINYDLHQSEENPGEFVMYENWTSAVHLDAHARSSHPQAFAEMASGWLERPTRITKWNMVSDLAP